MLGFAIRAATFVASFIVTSVVVRHCIRYLSKTSQLHKGTYSYVGRNGLGHVNVARHRPTPQLSSSCTPLECLLQVALFEGGRLRRFPTE